MRALVTGHRGFVGRWLVEMLAAKGVEVHGYAVGDDLAGTHDIRDSDQLRRAVEEAQPDLVFHLAAQAYVSEATADPHRAYAINVGGTINLLEAVRRVGPLGCRVLLAGTSEEYGYANRTQPITELTAIGPSTIYGASKAAATYAGVAYARQHNMPVVCTRAFNHTGPGQSPVYAISSFARRIALIEAGQLDVLEHGPLDAYRDFLDVRDVVRAYWAAIHTNPGIYNVSFGMARTMGRCLQDLIALVRPGVQVLLRQADDGGHRSPAAMAFHADSSRLRRATGWAPEISWTSTLTDLLNYWREQEKG